MTVAQDRHPPSGDVTSLDLDGAVERLTADTTLYDDTERLMSNEEPRRAHDILTDLRTLLTAYAASGEEIERLKADVTELVQINTDQNSKLGLAVKALEPFANFVDQAATWLKDDHVITAGSIMARRQLTARDCRLARSTLTEMRKT